MPLSDNMVLRNAFTIFYDILRSHIWGNIKDCLWRSIQAGLSVLILEKIKQRRHAYQSLFQLPEDSSTLLYPFLIFEMITAMLQKFVGALNENIGDLELKLTKQCSKLLLLDEPNQIQKHEIEVNRKGLFIVNDEFYIYVRQVENVARTVKT